jgi:hypothetical protein
LLKFGRDMAAMHGRGVVICRSTDETADSRRALQHMDADTATYVPLPMPKILAAIRRVDPGFGFNAESNVALREQVETYDPEYQIVLVFFVAAGVGRTVMGYDYQPTTAAVAIY